MGMRDQAGKCRSQDKGYGYPNLDLSLLCPVHEPKINYSLLIFLLALY